MKARIFSRMAGGYAAIWSNRQEMLADLKTLVVDTVSGHQVRIAALGIGAAVELAQLLSETLHG